jgi:DNA polymerase III alpha subunit
MDVDIDCDPRFKPQTIFKSWPRATVLRDGKMTPHPCGVYPQKMAVDPVTGLAAIPYELAEDFGFLKVDFLHLSVYQHFKSREEIETLLKKEPDWNLMLLPSTHAKLFQLSKHGELVRDVKPKSLMEVADIMALIRPAKKHFIGLYKKDPVACRKILYAADESGYSFKKSHALAYSYVVWLQLHLIEQGRL